MEEFEFMLLCGTYRSVSLLLGIPNVIEAVMAGHFVSCSRYRIEEGRKSDFTRKCP